MVLNIGTWYAESLPMKEMKMRITLLGTGSQESCQDTKKLLVSWYVALVIVRKNTGNK